MGHSLPEPLVLWRNVQTSVTPEWGSELHPMNCLISFYVLLDSVVHSEGHVLALHGRGRTGAACWKAAKRRSVSSGEFGMCFLQKSPLPQELDACRMHCGAALCQEGEH